MSTPQTLSDAELRDPTEAELTSPLFNEIWAAIKQWDICRDHSGLYAGATGTDVCTILDAIGRAGYSAADADDAGLRRAHQAVLNKYLDESSNDPVRPYMDGLLDAMAAIDAAIIKESGR